MPWYDGGWTISVIGKTVKRIADNNIGQQRERGIYIERDRARTRMCVRVRVRCVRVRVRVPVSVRESVRVCVCGV